MNWLHLPNKVLKYTSCLRCLIILNWCFLWCLFQRVGWHNSHAKPQDLAERPATLLAVEWKNILSVWGVPLKWGISSFCRDGSFSWHVLLLLSVRGFWEFRHLLILFYFYFSSHYKLIAFDFFLIRWYPTSCG